MMICGKVYRGSSPVRTARFECYLELLSRNYYPEISKETAIASIDRLHDDIIIKNDAYPYPGVTPISYLFYFGKSTKDLKIECISARFDIPGFSNANIKFNYENGKRTAECYLISPTFGMGRYNLTTGQSVPTNNGNIGKQELWDFFIASKGFERIVQELSFMAEGMEF